jgi:hypothetical protein
MKKHLITLAAFSLLAGCTCNVKNSSVMENTTQVKMMANNTITSDAGNEELDWMSQAILDKGKSFLQSGLSSLAAYTFKTACMEMGIDVRDATTKKIDQIIEKLDVMKKQIQDGFDNLTKQQRQVEDRENMDGVLTTINEIRSPILVHMRGLEDFARKEQNGYDKVKLKAEKEEFIDNFKTKLNFYGLSNEVWHSTELLALQLVKPNKFKPTQTLMDLYDNTLGANDIWDYQGYGPRMSFIKECAFLLNSLAILGKMECAKEISKYEPGDTNINIVKDSVQQMCDAVNMVNEVFQKELKKLYEIKKRHDDKTCPSMSHLKREFDSDGFVHITPDYTVSAYLATIDVNDVVWQNTVDDFYADATSHCFKTFEANKDFFDTIYDDYSSYIGTYKVEKGYNLKNYLEGLGFRVPEGREADYEEAIGIYKDIDVRREDRGFLRGVDFYANYRYYDWDGNLTHKDYCHVGQDFWHDFDGSEVYNENINKKMITFINPDNKSLYGGKYGGINWAIAHRDDNSTSKLINHFYRGNSSNDEEFAPYSVI